MVALLVASAVWAYTPTAYGLQSTLPIAGPESDKKQNNNRGFSFGSKGNGRGLNEGISSKLINFLKKNRHGEKFLVGVPGAGTVESIVFKN